MGALSLHFSIHEMALSEGAARAYGFEYTPYPEEWVETRLRPLFATLEKLRAKLGGKAIHIIEGGGYRPREYDLERIRRGAQGVSPDSQHHEGRAADIRVEGVTPEEVHAALLSLYDVGEISIGGLGIYDHFVHVDIRGGALHRWDMRTSK